MSSIRCQSCLKIEKYSHEAIEAGFAPQPASGQLAWMMKNLDKEANTHFIDDHKLYTKALVLVHYENGAQATARLFTRLTTIEQSSRLARPSSSSSLVPL